MLPYTRMLQKGKTYAPGGSAPRVPIVAAYYYPGWHACASRNVRGGKSEWNLLYDEVARQAYPDVRRPLAGAVETAPQNLEEEVRQAAAGGIDAFWWCWYWDHGRLIFNEALDMFLQCRLPSDFRYALMWVNKRPHPVLPAERPWSRQYDRARLIETDEEDFVAMIRHLIERHWSRREYLRLENRPLLPIFTIEPLIRQLGAPRLGKLLGMGEQLARAAGFPGVAYVAIMHRPNQSRRWLGRVGLARWAGVAPLREIGFSAVSTYVYLPDWDGPPRQPYAPLVEKRAREWRLFREQFGLPFWPSVSPGWDARTRGAPHDPAPQHHPWSPVVIDETPQAFARLLEHWKSFAQRSGDAEVLPICSWNEWTEGHAIAPCDRHGEGMLWALRQFKASLAPVAATNGIQ